MSLSDVKDYDEALELLKGKLDGESYLNTTPCWSAASLPRVQWTVEMRQRSPTSKPS